MLLLKVISWFRDKRWECKQNFNLQIKSTAHYFENQVSAYINYFLSYFWIVFFKIYLNKMNLYIVIQNLIPVIGIVDIFFFHYVLLEMTQKYL